MPTNPSHRGDLLHPDICAVHHLQDEAIEKIVTRVQLLVDQYHENRERMEVLVVKHEQLHRDFTHLERNLGRVVWAFLMAAIAAFSGFVLRGGLVP